ncbi:hypothetical protein [Martelella soudanensis]|uniref:hypothetical protein n=1 Tax=unclassified Martelella TaxID=2629616 RepID=UPI0015DF88D6|nr:MULTISPECIES: hypothetical protein [unclassified Martelella]
MTPRHAQAIVSGQIGRNALDQDRQRAAAWFGARLSAYAPEKASKFPSIDNFMTYRKPKSKPAAVRWQDQFAVVSAWIGKRKA